MSKLNDKVSYLRGLVEGMNFVETDNESKLILRIIDALDEVSKNIERMDESIEELGDYIESVDDDLEALEFGDDDLDYDFDDDEDDEDDEDFIDEDDEDVKEDGETAKGDKSVKKSRGQGWFMGDRSDMIEEDADESLADLDDAQGDEFGMYEGCLCPECGGIFSILVNADEDQQYICPHCKNRVTAVRMNCKNVPVANAFNGKNDK